MCLEIFPVAKFLLLHKLSIALKRVLAVNLIGSLDNQFEIDDAMLEDINLFKKSFFNKFLNSYIYII